MPEKGSVIFSVKENMCIQGSPSSEEVYTRERLLVEAGNALTVEVVPDEQGVFFTLTNGRRVFLILPMITLNAFKSLTPSPNKVNISLAALSLNEIQAKNGRLKSNG